jgi:hypothetical protein
MIRKLSMALALGTCLAGLQLTSVSTLSAKELKVISENTVARFGHVAYDPAGKVFYTSDFGPDLKPANKDGKGKITKVSMDGKIVGDGFIPVDHCDPLPIRERR